MKLLNVTLVSTILIASTIALASPQGFDNNKGNAPRGFNDATPTSIAQIKDQGRDDQIVTVRGRLVEFLGDDTYVFVDTENNKINVELDHDDKFNWSQIGKNELIDLTAEIDKEVFSTELKGISAIAVNTNNK